MPLPSLDQILPTDHLHVRAWVDPVIDQLGHDVRSAYVERYWLPILGPTTTLLLRQISARLDDQPDGYDLPILDTAASLGLGTSGGRHAPFLRAISRSAKFKLSRQVGSDALEVRRRIPPLTRTQIERLPAPLRDAHDRWQAEARRIPSADDQRRRACRLALSLLELGETTESAEAQLHRWKVHPAMAHEALRWARTRREGAARPPAPAPAAPAKTLRPAGDAA